jgi:hypothetical protein
MKAKSQNQQQAAGAALAAKRGEIEKDDLKGASKNMYENMTEDELEEMASVSHEKLPEKKENQENSRNP